MKFYKNFTPKVSSYTQTMTPNEPQAPTTPAQPQTSGERGEMRSLRCPDPDCNAHLLWYRATSDLQIEIKCYTCLRKRRRGVLRHFVILFQRLTEPKPADPT